MELKIIIRGELPDLNSYISAMNRNRYIGAEMKRTATEWVMMWARKKPVKSLPPPYHITFNWFCKNKKKDKDNISSMGRKCILDGLQMVSVIPQDSWNIVDGFSDFFFIDKDNPRIEVIIKSLN